MEERKQAIEELLVELKVGDRGVELLKELGEEKLGNLINKIEEIKDTITPEEAEKLIETAQKEVKKEAEAKAKEEEARKQAIEELLVELKVGDRGVELLNELGEEKLGNLINKIEETKDKITSEEAEKLIEEAQAEAKKEEEARKQAIEELLVELKVGDRGVELLNELGEERLGNLINKIEELKDKITPEEAEKLIEEAQVEAKKEEEPKDEGEEDKFGSQADHDAMVNAEDEYAKAYEEALKDEAEEDKFGSQADHDAMVNVEDEYAKAYEEALKDEAEEHKERPGTPGTSDSSRSGTSGTITQKTKLTPELLTQDSAIYVKDSMTDLLIKTNAEISSFVEVRVGGKTLNPSNYVLKEGSTIVTLKNSYLETLPLGKYVLEVVSKETDNYNASILKTTLMVVKGQKKQEVKPTPEVSKPEASTQEDAKQSENKENPNTGDFGVVTSVMTAMVAGAALVATRKRNK
ncbi:hypothetical protein [Helcococcus bovis]|uniref:hypothetical protein n=1 Tax=Helcococcus bovis TaxID=3153252 RepID=UPI0038B8CCF9